MSCGYIMSYWYYAWLVVIISGRYFGWLVDIMSGYYYVLLVLFLDSIMSGWNYIWLVLCLGGLYIPAVNIKQEQTFPARADHG